MRLNDISPAKGARKERTRVGRGIGSGLGKTAGRGHKGQHSRSGKGKVKAGFEGGQMPLQRRLPKIGFRSRTSQECDQVMLYQLEALALDSVDFAALQAAGLVSRLAVRAKIVKKGELSRALAIKGVAVTAGAREAILAAGGSVE